MLRLFVAIDIEDPQRRQLETLCAGLRSARWSDPGQHHLTLRFLGATADARLPDIEAALGRVRAAPFELALSGVGTFPPEPDPARVLWVGVTPVRPVRSLKALIDDALGPDSERSGREFSPHLTLARFRERPGPELAAYLARNAAFASAPWRVRSFQLYRSDLRTDRAVHTVVRSFAF